MINASGPGAVLRKKCRGEVGEEDDELGGRVISNVDVNLLVLCGVRIANLAWASEGEGVGYCWVEGFGGHCEIWICCRSGNGYAGIDLYKYGQYYLGEGKPGDGEICPEMELR